MQTPFIINDNNYIKIVDSIFNFFLLFVSYIIILVKYGKKIDYVIMFFFTALQIIICTLIKPSCYGVSIIWNGLFGYFLIKSIQDKSKYIFSLCLLLGLSNLYFYNYSLKTHVVHILAFLLGFTIGYFINNSKIKSAQGVENNKTSERDRL